MDLEKTISEVVKSLLSREDLIEKSFSLLGLKIRPEDSRFTSESIKEVDLSREILDELEKNGFKWDTQRGDGILTLSDNNPQEIVLGWSPSNWWNFRTGEEEIDKLAINLHLRSSINQRRRGIVFTPVAYGSFSSPCDHLPKWRFFKAVYSFYKGKNEKVHSAIKRIAESEEGFFVVTWSEIGLAGIRSLDKLFKEFIGDNEKIEELARCDISPFSFYPRLNNKRGTCYAKEEIHPLIFDIWKEQLEEFKSSISL